MDQTKHNTTKKSNNCLKVIVVQYCLTEFPTCLLGEGGTLYCCDLKILRKMIHATKLYHESGEQLQCNVFHENSGATCAL